jgi:hypothetical protein
MRTMSLFSGEDNKWEGGHEEIREGGYDDTALIENGIHTNREWRVRKYDWRDTQNKTIGRKYRFYSTQTKETLIYVVEL